MFLDSAAVPFLTFIGLGIIALFVSALLRRIVEHRIEHARQSMVAAELHAQEGQHTPEPFWLRYGEAIKRSIQTLAWTLVGLGVLNLISYAFQQLAQNLSRDRQDSVRLQFASDVEKFSFFIKQGADVMLKIMIIVVIGVWIARFFQGAVRSLLRGGLNERLLNSHPRLEARRATLMTTAGYVVNVVVFVLCALMALQQIGVSVAPLLATAGVASVAIGFGAQSLVRDLFAGFFILFEDQFAVGDVVTIEGRTGTVEYMTLRLTKIRLGDGSLLMIPNGEIKKIENATSGFSQIDFKIVVVVGAQVDLVLSLLAGELSRLAADFKDDIVANPELLGVDTIKNSTITVRARVRTRPGRHFPLERELNQRVVARFLQANIQLPPND
ncbi:MAG: mechanosensitive ion channel family protein [Betaproteobacteria bacterium]|nr:mechanosensitive ion channel family protein [Betaproteobacteria bacterium]